MDDDAAFLGFLAEALAHAGHEFKTANNGPDALVLAAQFKPDIVLLDLMMPGMHGYQVCSTIKQDEALASARIIIMSAKGYEYDRRQAAAAGADHYLVKPFSLKDLLAAIG